jgi:hypothetical protein
MPTLPAIPPSASGAQPLDIVREELLALDGRALIPINVDVAASALRVLGAAQDIASHREELVGFFGEEMTRSIDRLELLARATLQAHAKHKAAESGAEIAPLSSQLGTTRDALLAEVRALIARGVLSGSLITELSPGHGHQNQVVDVLQLVSVLRDNWDVIEHETGLALRYIDRADALANELALAVGQRGQGARSPAADLRQRAFTLLAQTYDDVRRMITFLRWKRGDAERIAPSFFRGRGLGRGRRRAEESEITPPVDAPEIAPGMPGAPPFTEPDETEPTTGR